MKKSLLLQQLNLYFSILKVQNLDDLLRKLKENSVLKVLAFLFSFIRKTRINFSSFVIILKVQISLQSKNLLIV
jgi:hypothetical protein